MPMHRVVVNGPREKEPPLTCSRLSAPLIFILIARAFRHVHVVLRFVSEFITILLGKAQMHFRPGLEVIKLFPCSTQLSMKFMMLIKVKMPTIVCI